MSAPNLTVDVQKHKLSAVGGFNKLDVKFKSDVSYTKFECRATKSGEAWGHGIGELVASFSQTPADTERTFEIYDTHLTNGDGKYRISLFAQGEDGSWNDNQPFVISGASGGFRTADGIKFLCMR